MVLKMAANGYDDGFRRGWMDGCMEGCWKLLAVLLPVKAPRLCDRLSSVSCINGVERIPPLTTRSLFVCLSLVSSEGLQPSHHVGMDYGYTYENCCLLLQIFMAAAVVSQVLSLCV